MVVDTSRGSNEDLGLGSNGDPNLVLICLTDDKNESPLTNGRERVREAMTYTRSQDSYLMHRRYIPRKQVRGGPLGCLANRCSPLSYLWSRRDNRPHTEKASPDLFFAVAMPSISGHAEMPIDRRLGPSPSCSRPRHGTKVEDPSTCISRSDCSKLPLLLKHVSMSALSSFDKANRFLKCRPRPTSPLIGRQVPRGWEPLTNPFTQTGLAPFTRTFIKNAPQRKFLLFFFSFFFIKKHLSCHDPHPANPRCCVAFPL